MRHRLAWLIAGICLVVGILLAISVKQQGMLDMDVQVATWIGEHVASKRLTPFVVLLTQMGSAAWIIACLVIWGWLHRDPDSWSLTVLNVLLALLSNRVIKMAMMRERPAGPWLVQASGYSFPSAHAMCSLVFYGMLIHCLMRSTCNRLVKVVASSLLIVLIVMIGMSRIYVGVHYASDVLAGYCFGMVCLIAVCTTVHEHHKKSV